MISGSIAKLFIYSFREEVYQMFNKIEFLLSPSYWMVDLFAWLWHALESCWEWSILYERMRLDALFTLSIRVVHNQFVNWQE